MTDLYFLSSQNASVHALNYKICLYLINLRGDELNIRQFFWVIQTEPTDRQTHIQTFQKLRTTTLAALAGVGSRYNIS